MRVRKAVSIARNATTPDPTLLWYSRAIGIMRTRRKFADPTSWRFQGAVHDYDPSTDPYKSPGDPTPATRIQTGFWKKCQHSSWFFVPWHRMYLFFFEQIVAAAVVEAGGPKDWTLPYWDYTASAAARKLPWAFGQPTWPGGETNYLYVARRAPGINAGTTSLSPRDVETATALGKLLFSTSKTSSDVEFGGPQVQNHDGGVYPFGGVESSPHNHVHVSVGGPQGFMYDPTLAALDPIFWLHHANIDRLWEVWIRESNRLNPQQLSWLKGSKFKFYDAKRKVVTMTSSEVTDTRKLDYIYDGMSAIRRAVLESVVAAPRVRRLSMIGATQAPLALERSALHTVISTVALPAAASAGLEGVAGASTVLLHLENLEGKENAGSYDVFVNLPRRADPGDHPQLHAGRISMFGARAAKRRVRDHARVGFSFVLDVTRIYQALSAAGSWDPEHVRVSLVPVYDWSDEVKVGRISVNTR